MRLKKEQLAIFAVIAAMVVIYRLAMDPGISIHNYTPQNQEESQIIDLLIKFQGAKTDRHLAAYLSCLSDDGKFMFAGAVMVSKEELSRLLPPFWADLKSNRLAALPSSREELNGNFFDGGLYDPVIRVEGDRARAILTFTTPVTRWTTKLFLIFQRENNGWEISRLEWDMG